MVKEINQADFEKEILESAAPALVDFWAPWCGPCRMLAPILEEVSAELPDVKFAKINTDENTELAARYDIAGIPCLILFKGGQEITRFVGVQQRNVLIDKIKASI